MPLAKLSPDDPTTVEVFECCINGQEISPGYTEQNDPIAQRTTLEHQAGDEQQKLDKDFLVALEHGMPARAAATPNPDSALHPQYQAVAVRTVGPIYVGDRQATATVKRPTG